MILDHLSPHAQFANGSMSGVFRHLFPSLLVERLQGRSVHLNSHTLSHLIKVTAKKFGASFHAFIHALSFPATLLTNVSPKGWFFRRDWTAAQHIGDDREDPLLS